MRLLEEPHSFQHESFQVFPVSKHARNLFGTIIPAARFLQSNEVSFRLVMWLSWNASHTVIHVHTIMNMIDSEWVKPLFASVMEDLFMIFEVLSKCLSKSLPLVLNMILCTVFVKINCLVKAIEVNHHGM